MTPESARTRQHRYIILVASLIPLGLLVIVDPQLYVLFVMHATAVFAVMFPFVYRLLPWKSGPTGVALMNKARSLAIAYTVALVGLWWHPPAYDYVYAAALTYLGVSIAYQLYVFARVRQAGMERRMHPREDSHEASTPVRPDHPRREDRRLVDEGRAAEG